MQKLDEVLALAASSLASWNHVTLAAAFVALASNARTKSSLGALLDSESYARMEEKAAHASVPALGARGVVNILHSVATLHQRHRRFFDRKSLTQQRGFNPSPDLALALDAAVERTAGHMRPREVAAALWSYAALDAAPLAPTLASSLTSPPIGAQNGPSRGGPPGVRTGRGRSRGGRHRDRARKAGRDPGGGGRGGERARGW